MDPDDVPRARDAFLDVSGILEPTSIAVIGASERPGNLGGDTVRRLVKFGFPGPVWPVNRSRRGRGRACRHSPRWPTLPGVPHLAVLAVPAEALLDAVRECAGRGRPLRRRLRGRARRGRRRGRRAPARARRPVPRDGLHPVRAELRRGHQRDAARDPDVLHGAPRDRRAAARRASRSSPRAAASRRRALSLIQQAGFGCRHMISSGNEAVVGYADYLYALARDEGTHVIAGYLEGTADNAKLVRALEEARRRRKPVVLIKAGATSASARAAQAHTGALVGEERVVDAVLRELGVIRVYSIEELVDVALLLEREPRAGCRPARASASSPSAAATASWRWTSARSSASTTPAAQRRGRRAAAAAAHLGGDGGESARPHADHGVPRGVARAPAAGARRRRRRAGDPFRPRHRGLAGGQGRRDRRRSWRVSRAGRRSRSASAGPRRPSASRSAWPPARHLLLPRSRPRRAGARAPRRAARRAPARRPPRPAATGLAAFDWAAHVPPPAGHVVVPEDRCHRILQAAGLRGGGRAPGPGRGGGPPRGRGARLPGGAEGHQPERDPPRGGGAPRGRSPHRRRRWRPRLAGSSGARPRDRRRRSTASTSRRCTRAARSSCSRPSATRCSA